MESPETKLSALAQLAESPGWALFVARWRRDLREQVELKILSHKTTDDEANGLRRAHTTLTVIFDPETVIGVMKNEQRNALLRAERDANIPTSRT
jgi:hypothetical protein